jgi:hypothetical protein
VLAVALVAVVAVGLPRSGPAYAATPPLLLPLAAPEGPAAPVLERAAAAAATLPPLGDGSHAYVRMASWYLHTSVGGGRVTSEIVPSISETWTGPDGAVTVAASRGAAQPAGAPGPAGNAEALAALPDHADAEIARYAPGEHGTGAGDLPADPARLRAALLGNEQIPDGPELIRAVSDVLRTTPVAPEGLSALWGALALQPDLVTYGATTDRAGRPAVAIGIESDAGGLPSRELLLLDPDTGRALGSEEVLTSDPGQLNVRVPAVISYEVYLAAGLVPRITAAEELEATVVVGTRPAPGGGRAGRRPRTRR